jgi:hypothetical protein
LKASLEVNREVGQSQVSSPETVSADPWSTRDVHTGPFMLAGPEDSRHRNAQSDLTVSSTAIKDDAAPNSLAKHLPVGLFVERAKNQFVF